MRYTIGENLCLCLLPESDESKWSTKDATRSRVRRTVDFTFFPSRQRRAPLRVCSGNNESCPRPLKFYSILQLYTLSNANNSSNYAKYTLSRPLARTSSLLTNSNDMHRRCPKTLHSASPLVVNLLVSFLVHPRMTKQMKKLRPRRATPQQINFRCLDQVNNGRSSWRVFKSLRKVHLKVHCHH